MKNLSIWIVASILFGFIVAWLYVMHSKPYEAGLNWIRHDNFVREKVGQVRHEFPDIAKFRLYNSGGVHEARFAVFVIGCKGRAHVELVVRKQVLEWRVVATKISDE